MQPFLIDTHAHVYLPEFDNDRGAALDRATAAGVRKICLPAIDASTHEKMLQTEAAYPVCVSMMGLHPCSVKDDFAKELEIVKGYLAQRTFVAVGEIGLDFYWDKTYALQQYDAFRQQIELALAHNLPVVVHSRNAVDECIEVVAKYPALRGVFHCFSGSEVQALKIIECGFLLGIGGVLTFKNAGLDKVMERVGLAAVVLETDAPYLSPVPYRGKRNEPAYTSLVAEKLATAVKLPVEEVIAVTTSNAEKLFGFGKNP